MEIKLDFDPNSVILKANGTIEKCQKRLDSQVLKDSNYYIPMDTGTLKKSSILHTVIGSGLLVWQTPYAKKLYYNENIKISEQVNPNASRKWFEVAKSKNKELWSKLVNEEYRKNY